VKIELIHVSECAHGDDAAELFGQALVDIGPPARRLRTTVVSRTEEAVRRRVGRSSTRPAGKKLSRAGLLIGPR
jgi:hypothetical protein